MEGKVSEHILIRGIRKGRTVALDLNSHKQKLMAEVDVCTVDARYMIDDRVNYDVGRGRQVRPLLERADGIVC